MPSGDHISQAKVKALCAKCGFADVPGSAFMVTSPASGDLRRLFPAVEETPEPIYPASMHYERASGGASRKVH